MCAKLRYAHVARMRVRCACARDRSMQSAKFSLKNTCTHFVPKRESFLLYGIIARCSTTNFNLLAMIINFAIVLLEIYIRLHNKLQFI